MKLDRIIAVRNTKTVYRDSDKCIKSFISGYSKTDILNEAYNLAMIEETGLNTPELIEVTRIDGKWSIVTEFIKGKTLSQLMKEFPDKKDEYLKLFVETQITIHEKSCPALIKQRDILNRNIIQCELDANTRYDLYNRLERMPRHTKLCHGDFCPSNIIIDDEGISHVIDWSHAAQGNASADAAETYLMFWMNGDISGAQRYLDLFCELSGIDKEYIIEWMPLVAAAKTLKCNEKQKEFLLSWI
ncbi:MAG: aminoglycoside phosphotransferase [Ruminococcaceae bacterium]|nr:aminoglycoside phosphotransferase [Oscillospiraceae bacterium]